MANDPEQNRPDESSDTLDDDGLLHDEYTDPSLGEVDSLDALDVPGALRDVSVLNEMADDSDGIEELDVLGTEEDQMDTVDTGARSYSLDEAEMGLGSEPHSAEELAAAAIGHALRGRAGVTRDDEAHGEMFMDSPDDNGDDE